MSGPAGQGRTPEVTDQRVISVATIRGAVGATVDSVVEAVALADAADAAVGIDG